jgi:cell division protein ZapA
LKQSIEVTISGQRYVLRSDGNSEQLRALAEHVNAKMEEVRALVKGLSPERLAVLTALNLADELMREREDARALRAEVRRRSQAVLATLRELQEAETAGDLGEPAAPPSAG